MRNLLLDLARFVRPVWYSIYSLSSTIEVDFISKAKYVGAQIMIGRMKLNKIASLHLLSEHRM